MELFLYPTIGGLVYVAFLAAILVEAFLYKSRRGRPYPWAEGGISFVVAIGHGAAGFHECRQVPRRRALGGWSLAARQQGNALLELAAEVTDLRDQVKVSSHHAAEAALQDWFG